MCAADALTRTVVDGVQCRECGGVRVVALLSEGDIVCSDCGLVLEDHTAAESFFDHERTGVAEYEVDGDGALGEGRLSGKEVDVGLKRAHERSNARATQKRVWIGRLRDAVERVPWMPSALLNHAVEVAKIVLGVHSFAAREQSAVFAALLWHSAIELNVRTYDFHVYEYAMGVFQESHDTGRSQRAFQLVHSVWTLYKRAHALNVMWSGEAAQLTEFLCDEARATPEQRARAQHVLTLDQLGDHTPLILATVALSVGMGFNAAHASKYSGVSTTGATTAAIQVSKAMHVCG